MKPVLSSWKEIAHYLGKGVRTAQRWEAEFGLPVRRAVHGTHRAVLAIPEEIDAWVRRYKSTGTVRMRGAEIDQLRSEVHRLQTENAALRLCLEASVSVAETHKMPDVYVSPPGESGSAIVLEQTSAALRTHKTNNLATDGSVG